MALRHEEPEGMGIAAIQPNAGTAWWTVTGNSEPGGLTVLLLLI